jgi:hypothetical protein
MDLGESLRVYGAILTTVCVLFGAIKWILAVKIAPIQVKNKELEKKNNEQDVEIKELKKAFLDEVKQISEANYNFRRDYENGIHKLELDLATNHVKKEDFQREMTDVHNRVDMSHDVKTIMESLKQLNS